MRPLSKAFAVATLAAMSLMPVATSQANTYFTEYQTIDVDSFDGVFWETIAYNYTTGEYVGSDVYEGNGSVYAAALSYNDWVGVWIYDYSLGTWSEGLYLYNERYL